MIKVNNLNKWYGNFHVLRDITFSARKGEVLGLLGPNGAGKSTTMKILTCFFKADSGEAEINGFDVNKNPLEVRKQIGYLHENAPCYPDMEVEAFLNFIGQMRNIKGKELKKRLNYIIELFRLEKMRKKRMGLLSKGYRQRVAFSQAIIHNPKVLILDEPSSGLDPNQIFEMREIIKNLAREKTIILCSHILSEVSVVCNRVFIIIDGKKAAFGTQSEISNELFGGKNLRLTVIGRNNPRSALEKLPGIINVEEDEKQKQKPANTETIRQERTYKLLYRSDVEPRDAIFNLVVEKKLKIREMTPISLDLEVIFRKLTSTL